MSVASPSLEKEMEDDKQLRDSIPKRNSMASTSVRPSLKSESRFNKYHIWKDKLRENCYKRVREERTRLLWKMRVPTSQSSKQNPEDIIRSAFQDIVSDEVKKIRDSSSDNPIKIQTSDCEMDDILWEYDGVYNYQGECEAILFEMQRIFYEDLKSEPTIKGLESQIETWEDEEEEYLAHAVYEHMRLNEDEAHRKVIWCPICKEGELKEGCHLIYCTHCELKLKKADELTLDFLRERLAEAHSEHLDRGCKMKPRFCLETRFNLTALYISCRDCDTFEVVI